MRILADIACKSLSHNPFCNLGTQPLQFLKVRTVLSPYLGIFAVREHTAENLDETSDDCSVQIHEFPGICEIYQRQYLESLDDSERFWSHIIAICKHNIIPRIS